MEASYDFAVGQHQLTAALRTLGEWTNDCGPITEALRLAESQRQSFSRDSSLSIWIINQRDIGLSLEDIGKMRGDVLRLKEAEIVLEVLVDNSDVRSNSYIYSDVASHLEAVRILIDRQKR
ncbi:MAG TPA: hypothetical protein VHD32_11490 [Candidatus Didemnitutus sp.]|nr:hypothetical protein [Candidatus Didemnitutus sp.]